MTQENDNKPEIDALSGVETTGHDWDGLKELNNPLPRWWLWVFLITCIWSFWYFIDYPAWPIPGGATEGRIGYTQYKELAESQQEILDRQAAYAERFKAASFEEILEDEGLYRFAMAGGSAAFKDNCATCHGSGASGSPGYPNLNDDDWIWGGTLADIHLTLEHGIRADDDETRFNQMPAYGPDGILASGEIIAVSDYVRSLTDSSITASAAGAQIFEEQCVACHGVGGTGMTEMGAPNLADSIWLYGGGRDAVIKSVTTGRGGVMPPWKSRLDAETIRQLTVYVHQLGGGEDSEDGR